MKEYIVRCEDNKFTIEGEIVRCNVSTDDYCSYGENQVIGKLEPVENATLEGEESTTGQPKSKLYIPLNQHTVERINRLHKNDCGDYFDEEWLYNELEQIAGRLQLPPETPTNKVDTPTDRHPNWFCADNIKNWSGLYIKVYVDDDPQDKAEKLYQICDSNEALAEVAKCIQAYLDEPSADAIEVMDAPPVEPVAKNATTTELETDDENELKFYYVESLDDYWVGQRLDNFYYATWQGRLGFIWSHSKYLPWGEHIVDEKTLWKEHTYPSEPIEIPFTEWIVGFVKKYFAEPKPDLVNRSDVLELAKSGVLISNDNYEKVCKAINGLPSCHTCRECEPVEPKPICEDAVSRNWILRTLETWQKVSDYNEAEQNIISAAICEVKDAPPVEPKRPKTTETMMVDGEPTEIDPLSYEVGYTRGQSERPKGKWKYGNGNGECPFCGREKQHGWDNFCGFCGADMRGDKEC